ncbi:hypothetical protein MMC30_005423 [Trapelia coarctata]|nr:hypothetical protein [Trapelia coarctata]
MSSPPATPPVEDETPEDTPEPSPFDETPPLESTQTEDFAKSSSPRAPRLPTLRSPADSPSATNMTASSSPLGSINAARRPQPPQSPVSTLRGAGLPQDMQAKMKALMLSRQGAPPGQSGRTAGAPGGNQAPSGGSIPSGAIGGGFTPSGPPQGGLRAPFVGGAGGFGGGVQARPANVSASSAPAIPNMRMNPKMGLAAKRGLNGAMMKLSDAMGTPPSSLSAGTGSTTEAKEGEAETPKKSETVFTKYEKIVNTSTGTLNFAGKATIHGQGIEFPDGTSFEISLDEVDTLEELGKGNYGTVYQVRHSRPQMRRPGLGLQGNKALKSVSTTFLPDAVNCHSEATVVSPRTPTQGNTTGLIMAMKEIRLELDEAKFAAIIMELDILHRCVSPFIIDFYGAFFQEGAVYICMEFMDGGSIDKLYGEGIPENVLRKIALSTIMGLKSLKDEHNIIHRDVKPTNILVNSRGQVKICDFGVSGNLVASIAKTNIGCQSYMAPERIAGGGVAQAGANAGGGTYSVQSDIWSLGLSIIECAMGRYPYPPETYNNIFSQLSAIVDGDPPDLPPEGYSDAARDFVCSCLHKIPKLRPTYAMLVRHSWLAPLMQPPSIAEEDEDESENTPTSSDTPQISLSTDPKVEDLLAIGSGATTADREVAAWVLSAMERRRLGKMGGSAKPALHQVALDAVPSPAVEKSGMAIAAGGGS